MAAIGFKKATKLKAKGKLAFIGPSGSGKTYSALEVATHLVAGMIAQDPALADHRNKIAVIDSEHETSQKYADLFDFDILGLNSFAPDTYVEAMEQAEEDGFLVTIVDGLSQAWMGKEGALEQVDKKADKGNSFSAWRFVTPMHNRLVDKLLAHKTHLICTMRQNVEWVVDTDEKGKKVPRKIGLKPVQRDGLEYEFDVVGDMDQDNQFTVSKTRCPALRQAVIPKPGKKLALTLLAWLSSGAEASTTPEAPDAGAVERMKEAFASIGVNDAKLEAYLGHSLSKMTNGEYMEMKGIGKSLREGRTTWVVVFNEKYPNKATQAPPAVDPAQTSAQVAPAPAKPPPTPGQALAEKMRAAKTLDELYAVRGQVAKAFADRALQMGEMTELGSLEAECDKNIRAASAPPAGESAKEGAPAGETTAAPGADSGKTNPPAIESSAGSSTPSGASSPASKQPPVSGSSSSAQDAGTGSTAAQSQQPKSSLTQTAAPAAEKKPDGPSSLPASSPSSTQPASGEPLLLDKMKACKTKPELKALRKIIAEMKDVPAKVACQKMYNDLLKKLPEAA